MSELPLRGSDAHPSVPARFPRASASAQAPSSPADSDELREILMTVSASQFEAFARDLRVLRDRGAESNTQAIIDAVRERAERVRVSRVDAKAAA